MSRQVVAMTCIPGLIERGDNIRTGTEYAEFGQMTWKWWCRQHGIEFVILTEPLDDFGGTGLPPSIQRWLVACELLESLGRDGRLALVDADTMIRWDAPNFLDMGAPRLAAAHGNSSLWINRSINAYQKFFPDIHLPVSHYFNSGVVVFGRKQLQMLESFREFIQVHWVALRAVQRSGNVGSDQTPFNFVARREGEPVHFLSSEFNMLNCGYSAKRFCEHGHEPSPEAFVDVLRGNSMIFDFVRKGFVWHFTALYRQRFLLMRETWNLVQEHYKS